MVDLGIDAEDIHSDNESSTKFEGIDENNADSRNSYETQEDAAKKILGKRKKKSSMPEQKMTPGFAKLIAIVDNDLKKKIASEKMSHLSNLPYFPIMKSQLPDYNNVVDNILSNKLTAQSNGEYMQQQQQQVPINMGDVSSIIDNLVTFIP